MGIADRLLASPVAPHEGRPVAPALRRPRRDYALAFLLVLAGAGLVHGPRVARNLSKPHWEDFRFFRHNRAEIHSLADCFTKPSVWPGLYRPLGTSCYYLAGRTLWANRLEGYHLVSAGLFALNGLLVFAVARRLLPRGLDVLPPLLFVTRRAHAQVPLYTSEFQALSSTALALVAVLLFLDGSRHWRVGRAALVTVAFAAALLCKEVVITLPVVLAASLRLLDRQPRWDRLLAPALAAAAFVAAFLTVLAPITSRPRGFTFDPSADMARRLAAHLADFSNLLVGDAVHVDMPERVLAVAAHPAALFLTAALLGAALAVLVRARREPPDPRPARVAAFGIAWFVAFAAPFLPYADRVFMRYSYLPHAGLALSAGALAWAAREAWRARGGLARFRA